MNSGKWVGWVNKTNTAEKCLRMRQVDRILPREDVKVFRSCQNLIMEAKQGATYMFCLSRKITDERNNECCYQKSIKNYSLHLQEIVLCKKMCDCR